MSNLNEHLVIIEQSLKYLTMNATVLTRFMYPPTPTKNDTEIIDYYGDVTIQDVLVESSRDLMDAIDDLRGEIDSLRRAINDDSTIIPQDLADKFNNLLNE